MKDREILGKCIDLTIEPDDIYTSRKYMLKIWKQAQKDLIIDQRKHLEELRKKHAGLGIVNIFLMEWEERFGLRKPIREQFKGDEK